MYSNILIAYDGSAHADKAMDVAMELAAKFDADLHLVQVVNHAHASSGSAKCSRHNFVFLEGVKVALTADSAWKHGWYDSPPTTGLRAIARVYAGWGFSQAFYRVEEDLKLGFSSLEDFLIAFWEGFFIHKDANNLLALLWTRQYADISDNEVFGGDFDKALAASTCKAIIMPGRTDLYFPVADNEYEVSKMPNCACSNRSMAISPRARSTRMM